MCYLVLSWCGGSSGNRRGLGHFGTGSIGPTSAWIQPPGAKTRILLNIYILELRLDELCHLSKSVLCEKYVDVFVFEIGLQLV